MTKNQLSHTRSSIYGVLQLYTGLHLVEIKDHLCKRDIRLRRLSVWEFRVREEFVGDFGFSEMHLMARDEASAEHVVWAVINKKVRKINKQ
jgi:hypothetical protein